MLVCWKCGASLTHLSLPLTRRDICKQCNADLHACKLCEFYSVSKAKHCREPIAEEVSDKQRANFCDYFKPKEDAYSNKGQSDGEKAKAQLDAMFKK
jgi:hypothetical protein